MTYLTNQKTPGQRIAEEFYSTPQLTIPRLARLIDAQLQATMQENDELRHALGLAGAVASRMTDEALRLREALTSLDHQAMQVMQDDVPPYGSILRCGWVHEVCQKALDQNEVSDN